MDKKYDHKLCENIDNLFEQKNNLYNKKNNRKDFFSIILPPPNVTGQLHLGHAWNGTIQDALIRFKSLSGYDIQWICGMDHAGIATQVKYEAYLKKEKINVIKAKEDRASFFNAINLWKNDNANSIRQQWQKMGFALEYKNEYFTLDNESSENVINSFVSLYEKGLIYRKKKMVNWDFKLKTAISNIEVINKPTKTKMYYVRYYLKDSKDYLVIATTRPETIFVDQCLFVNDTDKRYKKYINKIFINPLTNKELPLLVDEYIDPSFGTGVMKCTPAHDFNDYDLGIKHKLKIISCIDEAGLLNELCGEFASQDRIKVRDKIIDKLIKDNLLEKIDIVESNIGFSERSDEIVEPLLSLQWFLSVNSLCKEVIKIQNSKSAVDIYPNKFNANLMTWLTNMQDWCISRQLIWGHQIPAWYNPDNSSDIYVGLTPPSSNWVRDSDVLDTWFSSSLLPLTIGFYNKNYNNCFPTSILVTGYDIIFFWLARMIMFSIFFKKEIPFHNVYITGLIRDQHGKKMSKSLGNGIDPIDVIDEYGADSLRLFLLAASSPGEDLKFSYEKIKYYWSFLNKLWNSIRYILQEKDSFSNNKIDVDKCNFFDKWILAKFYKVNKKFIDEFNKFNFSIAIKYLLDFIWNDFCNNYLELSKDRIKDLANMVIFDISFYIIKNCLVLLNPICPFFTTFIYEKFIKFEESINLETFSSDIFDFECTFEDDFIEIINNVRKFRLVNNLSKKNVIKPTVTFLNVSKFDIFNKQLLEINKVLNSENINITTNYSSDNFKDMKSDYLSNNFFMDFGSINIKKIDIEEIQKKICFLDDEIKRCDSMLKNKTFLEKAPKDKITIEKNKREEFVSRKKELEKILLKEKR
ncbi:MAG: valine--tRNA ligase [Malacoplasma sp.]